MPVSVPVPALASVVTPNRDLICEMSISRGGDGNGAASGCGLGFAAGGCEAEDDERMFCARGAAGPGMGMAIGMADADADIGSDSDDNAKMAAIWRILVGGVIFGFSQVSVDPRWVPSGS